MANKLTPHTEEHFNEFVLNGKFTGLNMSDIVNRYNKQYPPVSKKPLTAEEIYQINNERFAQALQMANNCGKEDVANLRIPTKAGIKGLSAQIINPETRQDILLTAGVEKMTDFTHTELTAILFAYNSGWNAEYKTQNGILTEPTK